MARSLAVGAWLGTYYRGLVRAAPGLGPSARSGLAPKTRPTVPHGCTLYTTASYVALLGTSHRMICAGAGGSPQSAQVARRLLRAVPRRRNLAVVACPT